MTNDIPELPWLTRRSPRAALYAPEPIRQHRGRAILEFLGYAALGGAVVAAFAAIWIVTT